jgi:MFS family permease
MAIVSPESKAIEPERSGAPAADHLPKYVELRSGYYVIGVLLLINVFNYVDRVLPHVLSEAIRKDLNLTDTHIGILNGVAFTLVYAAVSLPLARLADRWSAKGVLVISLGIWSALTSLGGFAQNFVQLALTRSGVAAGEAGALPAAHSLISTHYSERRRGTMIAIYSLGASLGSMVGLIAGGKLADLYGWRMAMMVIGIPGILLAILVAVTIKNVIPAKVDVEVDASASFAGTLRFLAGKSSYRHMMAALVTSAACGLGFAAFNPIFLMRIHHLSMSQVGLTIGLIGGIAASLGILTGGILADRIGYRLPRWSLWVPGIAHFIAAPFVMATYFVPSLWMVVLCLIVPGFCAPMNLVVFAAAQRLAPPHMRAMASAVLALGITLIAGSLGPLIVGMVSDYLAPTLGVDSIRYALGGTAILYVWAAVHFYLGGKAFERDLAAQSNGAT